MNKNTVYCLFDTGDFAEVVVEIYDNDPSEPVQGYFLLDAGRHGFSLAAKRAAVRVFSILESRKTVLRKYSAMFDLSMAKSTDLTNIAGESGGLAFALVLAGEVMISSHKPVAATGIISADGSVDSVKQEGFDAKLDAAYRALPRGGLVLYPEENFIDDEIRERFKQKEIELFSVKTVAEALDVAGIVSEKNVAEALDAAGVRSEKNVETVENGKGVSYKVALIMTLLLVFCGIFYWFTHSGSIFFFPRSPKSASTASAMPPSQDEMTQDSSRKQEIPSAENKKQTFSELFNPFSTDRATANEELFE